MSIYSLKDVSPVLPEDGNYWIAHDANVIGNVVLNRLTSVWFGATIRGDNEEITIGSGSNIQENSVLHTDLGFPLKIGENCTIGHKAMLHGCIINNNTLIGMGATILNGAVIGENCLIGAGSLITEGKVIPPGSLVMGVPGKVIRDVTEDEKKAVLENTKHYQDNWKKYSKSVF